MNILKNLARLTGLAKSKQEPMILQAQGKLETSYEIFKERFHGSQGVHLFDIDIDELFPPFADQAVLPKSIHETIRGVLDDYLKEGQDYYFQADQKTFCIFFSKASKLVAELKIDVVRNELKRVLEQLHWQKSVKVVSAAPEKPEETPASPEPASAGTLPENPDEKEIKKWAMRAFMRMSEDYGQTELVADVMKLAEIVRIQYFPMWFVTKKIISGYIIKTTADLTSFEYDDKQAHQALAIMGAAARQLRLMSEHNQHALLVIPVHLQTICSKDMGELYITYCKTIEQHLKKYIVLQIKGWDSYKPSSADWGHLKLLAHHSRSMIVDTGAKKIEPASLNQIDFHSYGFDLGILKNLPEPELFPLIDDFAGFYQNLGKETFIFGIETQSMLTGALGSGYSYISGHAVSPPMTRPRHASFLGLEDLFTK